MGVGLNGFRYKFVNVIGTPHRDSVLAGFVKLQRGEARIINF